MFTINDSLAAETYWSRQYGIDERIAHAIAQVESHHDPYAVGDQGTSFGDYQLHRGGLLGSLTREQAFDPMQNARVALAHLRETMRKYPGVHDPGAIAALSQAPADREGYRRKVNQVLQTGASGGTSSAGVQNGVASTTVFSIPGTGWVGSAGSWTWDHSLGWVFHETGQGVEAVGSAISAPFVAIYNLLRGIWDFFTSSKTWIRIAFFVGGAVLIIGGARIAFS